MADRAHGSEIDTSFFVLTVDLWSSDGLREVNLVRHSSTSPSISAATPLSYPPPPTSIPIPYQSAYQTAPQPPPMPMAAGYGPPMMMHQPMHNPNAYHHHSGYLPPQYQQPPPPPQQQSSAHPPAHLPAPPMSSQPPPGYYHAPATTPVTPAHYYGAPVGSTQGPLLSPRDMPVQTIDPRSSPSGMFTRNLIGSLCVSAFKLTGPENNLGVWFILQDLSVRTEGSFRSVHPAVPFFFFFFFQCHEWGGWGELDPPGLIVICPTGSR